MVIYLNKEAHTLDNLCSLYDFLLERGLLIDPVAVAINEQFIPKSQFVNTLLNANDRIDLIVPMQGG